MNISYGNNLNFGKLQVSYDAQEKLEKSNIGNTYRLYRFGSYLRNTDEIDLQIDRNLTPKIKDRSELNCVYIGPYYVSVSKENPAVMQLTATKGLETHNKVKKEGRVTFDMHFGKPTEAIGTYKRILRAQDDIEKAALLTKILDAQRRKDREHEYFSKVNDCPEKLIDGVMHLYGDDVKPVK